MVGASPWRRVLAFALDYLVIALYIGLLAALMLTVGKPLTEAVRTPWQGHLLGFTTLTLPVLLYFTLSEHFALGTLGKRLLGLRVEARAGEALPLGSSLLRSAVKFLPWELAHTAIYRVAGWPRAPEPLTVWQILLFSLSLLLVAVYLTQLFAPPHRPPYDLLSGAAVRSLSAHPAFKEARS